MKIQEVSLNLIAVKLAVVNFRGARITSVITTINRMAKDSQVYQCFQKLVNILLHHYFRTIPFKKSHNCKTFLFQAHKKQNWDERQSLDLSIFDSHLCSEAICFLSPTHLLNGLKILHLIAILSNQPDFSALTN